MEESLLSTGQESLVPCGTPHVWWNGGSDEMKALVEFRPALQIEDFFSALFALAAGWKNQPRGCAEPAPDRGQ